MSEVLAGKDYFTVKEAAEYAGVSYSHWRDRVQKEFPPGLFFGKLLYRRADVQRFIENNTRWPQSIGGANQPTSTGRKVAPSAGSHSEESRRVTPRSPAKRRSLSLVQGGASLSPRHSSRTTQGVTSTGTESSSQTATTELSKSSISTSVNSTDELFRR